MFTQCTVSVLQWKCAETGIKGKTLLLNQISLLLIVMGEEDHYMSFLLHSTPPHSIHDDSPEHSSNH